MARELFMIDELGALPANWGRSNTSDWNFLTSGSQRSDLNGNGGTYCLNQAPFATGRWFQSHDIAIPLTNFWFGGGFYFGGSTTTSVNTCIFVWKSASDGGRIQFNNNSTVSIYVGTGVVKTSTRTLTRSQWARMDVEVFIHSSSGYIRVWIDQNVSDTPFVEFEGDTDNAGTLFTKFRWGNMNSSRVDDFVFNSISMLYREGTGSTPVAGNTITEGSATAVITAVETGSTGVAGRLIIEQWNGTAFTDDQVMTHTGGFSAKVDAPTSDYVSGLEPNSKNTGNEFVLLAKPNAVGNSSQLGMLGQGAAATETLTLAGQPNNADQVLIDAKTYTFQATLTNSDGNVHIGATASDTIDNLIAAITLGAGAGTDYATSMTIHPSCTAAAGAGDTMDASAIYNGTFGNSIATTAPTNVGGNLSWGAATMSGGTGENYEAVNDLPTASADYVEATTAGLRDTYKTDLSSVLPIPAEIAKITAVQVNLFALGDLGGIDNVQAIVRQGSTDYDSADITLPSSVGLLPDIRNTQPDGSGGFTRTALVDSGFEIGAELKS